MSRRNPHLPLAAFLAIAVSPATVLAQEAEYGSPEAKAMIEDALSAITPELAMGATVVDWEQNVLKEGDNGWTCFPTPANFEKAPMCLDEPWLAWAAGWMNQEPVSIDRVALVTCSRAIPAPAIPIRMRRSRRTIGSSPDLI